MKKTYRTVCVLLAAMVAGALAGCKKQASPTDEELYRAAVADAVFAEEDEICNLVSVGRTTKSCSSLITGTRTVIPKGRRSSRGTGICGRLPTANS